MFISDINKTQGAPDPTLGGSADEQAAYCLDSKNLKENIKNVKVVVGEYDVSIDAETEETEFR